MVYSATRTKLKEQLDFEAKLPIFWDDVIRYLQTTGQYNLTNHCPALRVCL
jgi:hypothetical protein